jgi:hypothetical protein
LEDASELRLDPEQRKEPEVTPRPSTLSGSPPLLRLKPICVTAAICSKTWFCAAMAA